ncbi:MAG: dephospho-CoA kinase [Rhodospirillales bacterium]|nr:dephospho-CoA kinase [Rhodospirillales bacterium]
MKYPFTIIGLTGSIGMGKSETAKMFARLGVPVHDADASVHKLFSKGGKAVAPVEAAFPGVVEKGAVNRQRLGKMVFGNVEALKKLEAIVHPLVGEEKQKFLKQAALAGQKMVVLDIPLLFETGGDLNCDMTVVVSAPKFLQTQRVMARPDMTAEKLASIRGAQMDDQDKRRRADIVIKTSLGKAFTLKKVQKVIKMVRKGKISA